MYVIIIFGNGYLVVRIRGRWSSFTANDTGYFQVLTTFGLPGFAVFVCYFNITHAKKKKKKERKKNLPQCPKSGRLYICLPHWPRPCVYTYKDKPNNSICLLFQHHTRQKKKKKERKKNLPQCPKSGRLYICLPHWPRPCVYTYKDKPNNYIITEIYCRYPGVL